MNIGFQGNQNAILGLKTSRIHENYSPLLQEMLHICNLNNSELENIYVERERLENVRTIDKKDRTENVREVPQ